MSESLQSIGRVLIAASVFLTCAVFLPALADPVNVVKLTLLVLCALCLVFLLVAGTLKTRILTLPRGPAAWAGAALLVALVVAAVVAPNTTTAVVGTYGRNSGLMAYAAALILFFAGLRLWTVSTGHILALAVLAAGCFTASYGLLQYAGVDVVHWNNPFSPVIASLGNPDFASAYLGMCTPVAAWGALWNRWPLPLRAASAITGVMCLVAAVLSKAIQGPFAAAAGLSVLAAAVLLDRRDRVRRVGLATLAGVVGLAAGALAAGAVKLGPAAPIFRRSSFQARQYYWDGAIAMFQRRPLVGVGLDHYGAYWRQVRSGAATRVLGGDAYSDAAHSVPMQMLAQGGLLLALAYLAFVLTVAVYLVRGLLRLEGPARLLLGALGGTWTAYVISSTVSIDQVPLLTLEFVTAGAVVGLSGISAQLIRLPGALPEMTEAAPRRGRKVVLPRSRAITGADAAALTAAGAMLLALAWFSWLPFRANASVRQGDVALAAGRGNDALTAYQRANSLLPGVGTYWEKTGFLYESVRHPELALPAYRRGIGHDPFDLALVTNAAQLAAGAQLITEGDRLWRRAVELDPTNPATLTRAAAFETTHDQPQKALRLLARPLAVLPDNHDLWIATGSARAAAGDTKGARAAFLRALALVPDSAPAKEALASLTAVATHG